MSLQRTTRIGLGVVGLLAIAVAGLGTYGYLIRGGKRGAGGGAAAGAIAIAVTGKACDPMTLQVEAGRVVFQIANRSDRALEWEILQGVMVVEERENIAPGLSATLAARLDPGVYEITCGLLSNPRGKLTVVAAAGNGTAAAPRPSLVQLIGPIAEYKVYATIEADALVAGTAKLVAAVKAGDLAGAQALYGEAHLHYERIKPVAALFADLDAAIDARADDFGQREADPAFTGFHRLEHGLITDRSTQDLVPLADKLLADVETLRDRIRSATIAPERMAGGAVSLMERGGAGLADIRARAEGAQKIAALLQPLTLKADKDLSGRIDAGFAALDRQLDSLRLPDGGFESFDKLSQDQRTRLQGQVAALAADLTAMRQVLGLD
jgi:iron uptake system component EfeO